MANDAVQTLDAGFAAFHGVADVLISIFCLASVFILAPGCVPVPHNYEPITFRVIDGETGKPIPLATGGVSYERQWLVMNMPKDVETVADSDGRMILRVNGLATQFSWSANGYQPFIADGYVPHDPERVGVRRSSKNGGDELTVPLYREKAPVAAVELKENFRGLIVVELRPTDALSSAIGKRLFKVPVSSGGYAALDGVPLLTRIKPLEWTVCRTDGSVVDPNDISFDSVRFRWIHSWRRQSDQGLYHVHMFAVASVEECERARQIVFDIDEPGTHNIFRESQAKQELLLDIIRSALAAVSVSEAEALMKVRASK